MKQTLFLSVLASSMTLNTAENPAALASIALTTDYNFDSNVEAVIKVTDFKTPATLDDPLSNLVFNLVFKDKVDGSILSEVTGRLNTGGGILGLEENHSSDFGYIASKLDFYGALNNENDFFDSIETSYDVDQADDIVSALDTIGVLNELGAYRVKTADISVPASTVTDLTPEEISSAIINMGERPRYITCCEIDSLPNIEALAAVMNKINCHVLLDVGEITDWQTVVALAQSISINDHRFWVFWNPNKSRPSPIPSVLSRKKWRPCVGDYLGQLLLRNSVVNASGIPPIARPVAGYDFPVLFRDMETLEGVRLTDNEEAQNALADAGVNVVLNERFEGGDRWVYGDALTQYDSKTSVLRLINSSEIETYTTNLVLGIVKKHLLKGMSSFITDATDECTRAIDACADAGLLIQSTDLGGLYYALQITPRADNPFEKADVKFSRRPEGCARQVFLDTAVTR